MHPVIADPGRFSAPPLFRSNTAPNRLRVGRIGPTRAFIFVTLTTLFPWRRPCGLHADLRSIVKILRPHFAAGADRHSETRRRLRPWSSVPRPIRKTRPPHGWVDSGVAENTPGNKLSCSVLNLLPSRTHISVLGNCLSSSTATPPSEHTPLRRRCCSEPFFRLSQTQYGSRSPPSDF